MSIQTTTIFENASPARGNGPCFYSSHHMALACTPLVRFRQPGNSIQHAPARPLLRGTPQAAIAGGMARRFPRYRSDRKRCGHPTIQCGGYPEHRRVVFWHAVLPQPGPGAGRLERQLQVVRSALRIRVVSGYQWRDSRGLPCTNSDDYVGFSSRCPWL